MKKKGSRLSNHAVMTVELQLRTDITLTLQLFVALHYRFNIELIRT